MEKQAQAAPAAAATFFVADDADASACAVPAASAASSNASENTSNCVLSVHMCVWACHGTRNISLWTRGSRTSRQSWRLPSLQFRCDSEHTGTKQLQCRPANAPHQQPASSYQPRSDSSEPSRIFSPGPSGFIPSLFCAARIQWASRMCAMCPAFDLPSPPLRPSLVS